jgi:hypothetical protein
MLSNSESVRSFNTCVRGSRELRDLPSQSATMNAKSRVVDEAVEIGARVSLTNRTDEERAFTGHRSKFVPAGEK